MAVKGPPPPMARSLAHRPPPKGTKAGAGRGAGGRASGAAKGKNSPNVQVEHSVQSAIDTDADAEEAAGYRRHHATDLEEEVRRNLALEGDNTAKREEELKKQEKLKRVSWGDERKKRGRRDQDDTEDGEEAAKAAEDAKAAGLTGADGAGKYFQEVPEDRMGDLSLHDPNEMKRILGPSARFAQHAMLLAQNQMDSSMSRAEALQYLAGLYSSVSDRKYANKALREFGAVTGILDIYPLEVVDNLMENVPGFFSKLQRGTFLSSTGPQGYDAKTGETISLAYPEDLRIRGFAIRGGQRPGYLLEPTDDLGTYKLVFLSPGRFEVLISAIAKDGRVLLEEFECRIKQGKAAEGLAALDRERVLDAESPANAPKEKKKSKRDDLTLNFRRRI